MSRAFSRRNFISGAGAFALHNNFLLSQTQDRRLAVPSGLTTPYKLGRLVLGGSKVDGAFDEKSVDCPFVFRGEDNFYMTFVGFDGKGY